MYFADMDATVVDGFYGERNPGPTVYIHKGNQFIVLDTEMGDYATFSKIFSSFTFLGNY